MPRGDPLFGSRALRAQLVVLDHATHPRRREETFPEPFVFDLRRQISQGLRCSGERLVRLVGLPTSLTNLVIA